MHTTTKDAVLLLPLYEKYILRLLFVKIIIITSKTVPGSQKSLSAQPTNLLIFLLWQRVERKKEHVTYWWQSKVSQIKNTYFIKRLPFNTFFSLPKSLQQKRSKKLSTCFAFHSILPFCKNCTRSSPKKLKINFITISHSCKREENSVEFPPASCFYKLCTLFSGKMLYAPSLIPTVILLPIHYPLLLNATAILWYPLINTRMKKLCV